MENFFKRFILILFVALFSQPVVKADEPTGQEASLLPQAQAVLMEDLDNERGRGGVDITSLSRSNVGATLRNNIAIDNITGSNSIDNGSIAGNSGITGVIVNSGNNVLIQSATTVNVTIIP